MKKDLGFFVRFGLGGLAGTLVKHGTLYVFTKYLGIYYLIAAIVAFIVGCVTSFIFQKFWTFKDADERTDTQFTLYFDCGTDYFIFNTIMMFVCVSQWGMNYNHVQIGLTLFIALASFFVTQKIFKP